MSASGRERRRAPRVHADFKIRLNERTEGTLRDISEIGLCCRTPEAIEEMTQVLIALDVPGADTSISVTGAVVRCDQLAQKDRVFEMAVYFTQIDDADRRILRSWIEDELAAAETAIEGDEF